MRCVGPIQNPLPCRTRTRTRTTVGLFPRLRVGYLERNRGIPARSQIADRSADRSADRNADRSAPDHDPVAWHTQILSEMVGYQRARAQQRRSQMADGRSQMADGRWQMADPSADRSADRSANRSEAVLWHANFAKKKQPISATKFQKKS